MRTPLIILTALVLAACASPTTTAPPGGATPTSTAADHAGDSGDHAGEFAFGEPADPADADRVVEVVAGDDLRFVPDTLTVDAGEVVTFRVTNEGSIVHDFTVGDEETQAEHEAEMAEMPGMVHDEPNLLTLDPGETAELTWRFATPGTVLLGCHQPGHYAGGMVATVDVR